MKEEIRWMPYKEYLLWKEFEEKFWQKHSPFIGWDIKEREAAGDESILPSPEGHQTK